MTTAILVMLIWVTGQSVQVSVTPTANMTTCHDAREIAQNTFRMYNERHPEKKIQRWTALCLDLSRWMESQKGLPARHVF